MSQRADPGAAVEVDGDDLAGCREPDIVQPVHVQVERLRRLEPSAGGVGQVLGGDEVLIGRQAHVADVDAAEQPVPVAIVRLALVEVVERSNARRVRAPSLDLVRGPEHLLVQVVDLAVLDLEVAPERAAQPAGLGPVLRRGAACSTSAKTQALVGGQGPFAHLGVRAGRDVDATDGRVVGQPGRGRHRRQPVRVRLERLEEPVDPAALAPAVLPGRRPRAELLAVVAHHPDPRAVLGRVVAQVLDDLLDVAERDPVAEPLLGPEDRAGAGPGPRSCTGPRAPPRGWRRHGSARRRGSSSRSRRLDQRGGQVRLPDPLGQPGAGRPSAEQSPRARRPSDGAGRPGRAPAATRGPARSSRRRGSPPGRARRARAADRRTRDAPPRSQSSSGPE